MKAKTIIVLLTLILVACAPAQTIPTANLTEVQHTAIAVVGTGVALTQTALPTATPLLSNSTPTQEITLVTGTPIPTLMPPPILTPDAIQVERWQEYQTELAKSIFPNDSPEWFLCEWDILGSSGQEMYAWAVCGVGKRSGSVPVVIYLNSDGSVQNVKKPKNWSIENIHNMFPEDVRNKFDYMYTGEIQKMLEHLEWRQTHPEEPPLIVLSATPTP